MIRYLASLIILLSLPFCCLSINPLDHTTLLQENDKLGIKPNEKLIDEEDPYYILVGEADKAIHEGDYITAVLRLRDALRVDPDNPVNPLVLSNLGMMYNMLDQDSLSLKAYNEALDLAPSMTAVYSNRAKLLLKMGRDQEAIKDFSFVIARDSLNIDSRFYRGMLSLYSRDLSTAMSDFNILKSLTPDSHNTSVAFSSLYTLTGQEKEAIPYLKKLIEQDPSIEYYTSLAGCYLTIEELSDASVIIAEAMEKYGDDAELYYYRAWLNRERYLMDDAHADAKKAIAMGADRKKVESLFKSH